MYAIKNRALVFLKIFLLLLLIYLSKSASSKSLIPISKIYEGVYHGEVVKDRKYPSMISIHKMMNGSHICGGVIYNSEWVLTTGRCVYEYDPAQLYVLVGSNTLSSGGRLFSISTIVVHPMFEPTNFTDDLAMLKISGHFEFSTSLEAAQMADVSDHNVSVVVAGWGNDSQSLISDQLRQVKVATVPFKKCFNISQRVFDTLPGQVCVYAATEKTPCNGDNGGPIYHDDKLVGLYSYRVSACGLEDVFVFTRVWFYRQWIADNSLYCGC